MIPLSRRGFLAASAGLAALPLLPARGRAAPSRSLTATTRTIEVAGKAATVYGLVNESGGPGLMLDPGARFDVRLTNGLSLPTLIHWHGQIPPNLQDGVPGMPAPLLAPGESRAYDFVPRPGTHWMHAHIPEQEVGLLAAPLIVRAPDETAQEVVILLHDFSFTPPEQVLAQITSGAAKPGMGHDMGAMEMDMGDSGGGGGHMGGMAMAMDLNDYDFDAYLANDRTLDDPEVVPVDKSGAVRLRIINGASATAFWIDTGALEARVLAVDGEEVLPLPGRRFPLAMGQRIDLGLTLPAEGGAFPILALREGAGERTGLILATPGARIDRLPGKAEPAPALDLGLEAALRAPIPLVDRAADTAAMLMLAGQMAPYRWTIDGEVWGRHRPVRARSGERVELTFHNMSMMAHPMHLHGHKFQVVDLGRGRFAGALRDTVLVPPMAAVTVALEAGEAASWMLHCHHMAHLATGMMTEFVVF